MVETETVFETLGANSNSDEDAKQSLPFALKYVAMHPTFSTSLARLWLQMTLSQKKNPPIS
jgi:hypothetical protein